MKLYEEDNNCKGKNYFLSPHYNFKQSYIKLKTLSTNQRLCNENYIHGLFGEKLHICINGRKIINILWIHQWYIPDLERSKELGQFFKDLNKKHPSIRFNYKASKTCIALLDTEIHLSYSKLHTMQRNKIDWHTTLIKNLNSQNQWKIVYLTVKPSKSSE